jgi:hypothetical protein
MTDAPFDLTGAVTFDLAAGRVSVKGSHARVLVPAEQLCALCDAAGEDATRSFGLALGESMGRRALDALGGSSESASVEAFVECLAAELALMGLGALGMERWGRAMLLTVSSNAAHDGMLKAALEGAIATATGRTARCVRLMDADGVRRYLVANPSAAVRVEQELAAGKGWGEVLVALHGASPAGSRGEA